MKVMRFSSVIRHNSLFQYFSARMWVTMTFDFKGAKIPMTPPPLKPMARFKNEAILRFLFKPVEKIIYHP